MITVAAPDSLYPTWFTIITDNTPIINFSDAKVKHDPGFSKPIMAREYSNGTAVTKPNSKIDTTEFNGVLVPIIDINGKAVDTNVLEEMLLSFVDFVPTLELTINDSKRDFQYIGGMGLSNKITVIITPSSNGVYRKLSIPFYIINQENLGDNKIKFTCKYYHKGLWENICTQIGDKPLTTYEFFDIISKRLFLGFAATDNCETINDARWRQIYGQTIEDFMKSQLAIGGLDEESIFDAWIDPYGYLNLVNLSWVMSVFIDPEYLVMTSQSKNLTPLEEKKPESTQAITKRFITNWTDLNLVENTIEEQYNNLNTKYTSKLGTVRHCWVLNNIGDTNTLEMQNIQMIENSVEGVQGITFYEINSTEFLGCEMSEDNPTVYQKAIRESYLAKQRSRQITVVLSSANMAYQRGMVVYVAYVESDLEKIKKIGNTEETVMTGSLFKFGEERPSDGSNFEADLQKITAGGNTDAELLTSNKKVIVNFALSGLYYIDGIEYYYNREEQRIVQYMYLIKRGIQSNMQNPFTGPRVG